MRLHGRSRGKQGRMLFCAHHDRTLQHKASRALRRNLTGRLQALTCMRRRARSSGNVAVEDTSPAKLPHSRLMTTVGDCRSEYDSHTDRDVSYAQ